MAWIWSALQQWASEQKRTKRDDGCPSCGSIMVWCSLTIGGTLAVPLEKSVGYQAEVLICHGDDSDCVLGWDVTQERLGWRS